MDALETIKNASRSAREEFEKKVKDSGLKVSQTRDGYLIYSSENADIDVPASLEKFQLPYETYGTGMYMVSCLPDVQKAVEEGLGIRITSSPSFQSIH